MSWNKVFRKEYGEVEFKSPNIYLAMFETDTQRLNLYNVVNKPETMKRVTHCVCSFLKSCQYDHKKTPCEYSKPDEKKSCQRKVSQEILRNHEQCKGDGEKSYNLTIEDCDNRECDKLQESNSEGPVQSGFSLEVIVGIVAIAVIIIVALVVIALIVLKKRSGRRSKNSKGGNGNGPNKPVNAGTSTMGKITADSKSITNRKRDSSQHTYIQTVPFERKAESTKSKQVGSTMVSKKTTSTNVENKSQMYLVV